MLNILQAGRLGHAYGHSIITYTSTICHTFSSPLLTRRVGFRASASLIPSAFSICLFRALALALIPLKFESRVYRLGWLALRILNANVWYGNAKAPWQRDPRLQLQLRLLPPLPQRIVLLDAGDTKEDYVGIHFDVQAQVM